MMLKPPIRSKFSPSTTNSLIPSLHQFINVINSNMASFSLVSPLVIFLFFTHHLLAQDELSNIVKLRNDLLTNQKYDKNVRPVKQHQTQVNVSFVMLVRSIHDIDVRTQSFAISGLLVLQWNDEHLTWSPSNYGGLNYTYFSTKDVWKPDIHSWSVKYGQASATPDILHVNATGTVTWWSRGHFRGNCQSDATNFPNDLLLCRIMWLSWSYDITKVRPV